MSLQYRPEFLTATILYWKPLLADEACKQIILNSLQWLTKQKKCTVYAFVIMPNHVHLIWKISDGWERINVQGAFFSFTAHEFKKYLQHNKQELLHEYEVSDADRNYQFWEHNPMIKECHTHPFFLQKLNYIHYNPCQPH